MSLSSRPVVHLIGLGSMGAIFAADLLNYTNASIIPIFRSKEKLAKFQNEANSELMIHRNYLPSRPILKYKFAKAYCPESTINEPFKNLVVSTKTFQTKSALTPYLKYIDSNTNLLLIQNGLGVLDDLKNDVFIDETRRPQLFQGVITHGGSQISDFTINNSSQGDLKISRLPWNQDRMIQKSCVLKEDRNENELMHLLTSETMVKGFNITHMTYQELLFSQLYKFVFNCCINPVTAILDCSIGEMKPNSTPLLTSIVVETLFVLRKAFSPLFQYESMYNGQEDYPAIDVNGKLSTDYMVGELLKYLEKHKNSSSSMREDAVHLRNTEIDYINGYVVRLANALGLSTESTKVNKTICELLNLRLGLNKVRSLNKIQGT
ncbi:uncharacterized protein NDAI_0D01570 [Naumovozyma dairenensis CBS 421]|uniref:2-dehydropantoate 2-reductase n=1 Tax=Naumovozyma dairenensis (strain ATCC 10597 / BCRC 20456 / CBS 421 / NBRC 0211 / NRRL Y-12639) TaxID=1071378 RepID=G0W9L0_NAUDC|nr:hypothetical protein NDAI_0D01570 [Naumovozyma dairenensis CBS 421]CCD24471.1 hypothetical protein NDAI_0D01570 [Naumovozyma dairenensis CBS 421]